VVRKNGRIASPAAVASLSTKVAKSTGPIHGLQRNPPRGGADT
jgi:hypothetical protein